MRVLAIMFLLAPTCSFAEVKYYFGPVKYISDGKVSSAVSLVKRNVDPEGGQILETVSEKRESEGAKTEDFRTLLSRIGSSRVFRVEMRGVHGTMEFSGGADWKWDQWTYDMKMDLPEATAKITGDGHIDDKGHLNSHKQIQYSKKDDHSTFLVERSEDLDEISGDLYQVKYKELHPPATRPR